MSPSPRHSIINGRRPLAPPPMHRGAGAHTMQKPNGLFEQSAHLRGQQRVNNRLGPQPGHARQSSAVPVLSSQPPSYSQASREVVPTRVLNPQTRPNQHVNLNQPQQNISQQQTGPFHVPTKPLNAVEVYAPSKCPSSTRTKISSIMQQPLVEHMESVELVPLQDSNIRLNGDYDLKTLDTMSYDRLKNESFDTDPGALDQPLSEEMLQKPLVERLGHVQKNLHTDQQSEFFQKLPTTEWEDAGDWFLDQFSSIIQRTKEARQKKRKLAQEFEDEIEKRHKHVSKKQHQVEDAMNRMKAQGEGLVPKSPKHSKSPKPKRG